MYLSEKDAADIKKAQAYLMKSKGAFPKDSTNIEKTLEFYFQCSALMCDTDTMSVIASTLANGGVNPFTGEKVLKSETVE